MGIEVSGPFPDSKQPFIALIDTGFSGFLSLPTIKALPLGLVLHGTTTVVLADGSQQSKFTCRGMIEFCGQKEVGLVILETVGRRGLGWDGIPEAASSAPCSSYRRPAP